MPIVQDDHGWVLTTKRTAYALGLNDAGLLTHRYWGVTLQGESDYPPPPSPKFWSAFNHAAELTPEEYPTFSDIKFNEPCLKATFADGTRTLDLQVQNVAVEDEQLHVTLQDAVFPFTVTLIYTVYPDEDIIARYVTLHNGGTEPVRLERAFSALWHLPPNGNYRLSHLAGRYNDEMHLYQEACTPGVKVLESRRLNTSHTHHPWFAVDRGNADEKQGEVWFGALAWSSNWKLAAEVTPFNATRMGIGLNDWDWAWELAPGETFTTPLALAGYTESGFGEASRLLHHYTRAHVLPRAAQPRQVLYNSWEATLFNVNETQQMRLAERAAAIGVELFVMDDGWFKGRVDDTAGLGDWTPDPIKFPRGLTPLIQHVQSLGMQFGLWIEPEMVNPNSDLYRAHPDWVLHFPSRPRTTGRNQLILNLARPDVQDYLIEVFDRLLSEHDIHFIKWDMNRAPSEPGWPDAPREPREVWTRYVYGVYRLWDTLRARHPNVIWQTCSGGGGRVDLGILARAEQAWLSDNTHADARLSIQDGYSRVYPAITMESWVTDASASKLSLPFRFHVSMCGVLGIGANILQWTDEEMTTAKGLIETFKLVRPIIHLGDQYRLQPFPTDGYHALQYVSKDQQESVLFLFRTHKPEPASPLTVKLMRLAPDTHYAMEGETGVAFGTHTGDYWMRVGVTVALPEFGSAMVRVRAQYSPAIRH